MRINIGSIREVKGASLDVEYEEPCPPLDGSGDPVVALGPLHGSVTVTNTGDCMLVRGLLSAPVEMTCSRCLAPFQRLLTREIEEEFFPVRAKKGRMSPEAWQAPEPVTAAGDGDDGINWYSGDVLDLAEATRENLQLAIPMKILCDEDCRGLCPHCGRNRNTGDCECRTEPVDPRLAALADWLRQKQSD